MEINKLRFLAKMFVVIILVMGVKFFEFRRIDPYLLDKLQEIGGVLCFVGFLFYVTNRSLKNPSVRFSKVFVYFLYSVLISSFLCALFWRQDFIVTLTSLVSYFYLFIYFVLLQLRISYRYLLRIIHVVAIVYAACFLIDTFSTEQLFGLKERNEAYGLIKTTFPGRSFMYVSFFVLIERIFKEKRIRLILMMLFYVPVFLLMGRRVMLFSLILGFIVMYIYYFKLSVATIFKFTLGAGAVIIGIFNYFENAIMEVINSTNEQISLAENYVRVQSFNFYMFNFSPNWFCEIFGNGFPSYRSTYGLYVKSIQENKGYWMADIGLFGFHVQFGILGVLAIVLIIRNFLKTRGVYSIYFLGIGTFFIPMALGNVEIVKYDTFLVFGLLMYLYELELKDKMFKTRVSKNLKRD